LKTKLLQLMKNRSIRKYIPGDYHPVAILPIGHPAESLSPETRARKPLEQTVCLNRYGDKSETSETIEEGEHSP